MIPHVLHTTQHAHTASNKLTGLQDNQVEPKSQSLQAKTKEDVPAQPLEMICYPDHCLAPVSYISMSSVFLPCNQHSRVRVTQTPLPRSMHGTLYNRQHWFLLTPKVWGDPREEKSHLVQRIPLRGNMCNMCLWAEAVNTSQMYSYVSICIPLVMQLDSVGTFKARGDRIGASKRKCDMVLWGQHLTKAAF